MIDKILPKVSHPYCQTYLKIWEIAEQIVLAFTVPFFDCLERGGGTNKLHVHKTMLCEFVFNFACI
ncbi:hypothetical protein SDC9_110244 [bioreactor metagenome]|uniref:Uncharacterized protein n=1 Tax=bioreactor metagenome TaxID=1076179 RepID=A0A645BNJ6_9ZZZZ